MNGRDLSESLARYLQSAKWMTWTNQPLGSVFWGNPGIVDVLAIFKSYSKPIVRIYEVKITRADFLRDMNSGKFLKYKENCNQFYFATLAGLIPRTDLPDGCGLISYGPNGWRAVKAAPMQDFELPRDVMMTLLLKGYQDHFEKYRQLERDKFTEYKGLREATYSFGIKLSRDIVESRQYVEEARELKRKVEELAGKEFPFLGDAIYWLRREVDSLLGKRKYAEEAGELVQIALRLFEGRSWDAEKNLHEIAEKLKRR